MTLDDRLPRSIRAAPDPSNTGYYALALTADRAGNVVWSSVSEWVGPGSRAMWEMRAPGLVSPRRVQMAWRTVGQVSMVVRDLTSLGDFLRIGGNALVAQSVARYWLQDVLQPVECVSVDPFLPPQPLDSIPKKSLNHAPSKKLRMQVLRRDDFRCRICGRRAADYVDIVLHVHHIRPHSMGGLTETGNLITLCHTCHCGLDPHFEVRLLSMVPGEASTMTDDLYLGSPTHEEGTQLYRRLSAPAIQLTFPESQSGREVPTSPGGHSQRSRESTHSDASEDPEAEDITGQGPNLWFQVIHNTLRKLVRPHETCGVNLTSD